MFEEAPNLEETGGQLFYYAGILFAGFLIFIGRRGGWVVEKSERIFFFFFCIVIIYGYGDCLTPLRENVCECLLEIDAYWNRAARVW